MHSQQRTRVVWLSLSFVISSFVMDVVRSRKTDAAAAAPVLAPAAAKKRKATATPQPTTAVTRLKWVLGAVIAVLMVSAVAHNVLGAVLVPRMRNGELFAVGYTVLFLGWLSSHALLTCVWRQLLWRASLYYVSRHRPGRG